MVLYLDPSFLSMTLVSMEITKKTDNAKGLQAVIYSIYLMGDRNSKNTVIVFHLCFSFLNEISGLWLFITFPFNDSYFSSVG